MVKIRHSKDKGCISCKAKSCISCKAKNGIFYDIGFGDSSNMCIVKLCDKCMHTLLQKLIQVGSDF